MVFRQEMCDFQGSFFVLTQFNNQACFHKSLVTLIAICMSVLIYGLFLAHPLQHSKPKRPATLESVVEWRFPPM